MAVNDILVKGKFTNKTKNFCCLCYFYFLDGLHFFWSSFLLGILPFWGHLQFPGNNQCISSHSLRKGEYRCWSRTKKSILHVCKYESMHVCMYPNTHIYGCIQVCKYISMQFCNHATIQPCNYSTMQVYMHLSTQVCKFESMQVCKHCRKHVCKCVDGWLKKHVESSLADSVFQFHYLVADNINNLVL